VSVSKGGGRQRSGAIAVAILLLLACALLAAPIAAASEFTVNSTADKADAVSGVNCAQGEVEECTLRAAIEEANSAGESGAIQFEEGVFEGGAGDTIALGSSLPTVTVPLTIGSGRMCPTAVGVEGPCVEIDGLSGDPALVFENAEEAQLLDVAITGAQTAVVLEGSPRVKIRGNWFGIKLDGSPGGNGTGVLAGPGSNRSFIGGEGDEHRNVFADSAGDGLDVHGASNVKVFGNYFGVEPDGVTPLANGGDDIEVASSGGFEATGTAIGTRVSSASAASPQCDGGCNVIAGAALNGVDLAGDGGVEAPAASTAIAGNYIGLNADGTAAVPNTGAGVRVGEAAHTVIGGPSAGEANRINGGNAGVLAGPAAGDLSVRGNLIGTDATGAGTLAPPGDGIVVNSDEFSSPGLEAEIGDNVIGMEGGLGVSQQGHGAWIFDNRIFGARIGIKVFGFSEYGNVIEGNLVEDLVANGVLIEGSFNEVIGNSIIGAAAAGIWVQGAPPVRADGNRIGGDTDEDENFIAGSGGAAIEISSPEKTRNEVARNSGIANGGPFIDLVAVSPGTELGPNDGIEPPEVFAATQSGAVGGAEAEARVRLFTKQSAAPGDLGSFLGEAVADEDGNWELAYDSPVPGGTIVAATQTSSFGGTSELASATTTGEVEAEGGGGGGAGSAAPVEVAAGPAGHNHSRPHTKITKAPKARTERSVVRFVFASDEPRSVFLCRLDDKPFDLCSSPKKYRRLTPGRHSFEVRAIDPAGHVDPSPAKKWFVVLD
jgi:CSLREA domain-containing protein